MTLRELLTAHGIESDDVLDAQVGRMNNGIVVTGRIEAAEYEPATLEIEVRCRARAVVERT